MNGCPKRIGILGAGSFGTALAVHLAGAGGHPVRLWARSSELARQMADERANPEYLPDVELPAGIEPTSDMADLGDSEFLLVAAPSHGFREVLRQFLRQHPDGEPLPLVSATKGIEPETLARMSQVAARSASPCSRGPPSPPSWPATCPARP
jgi:glycerol-3-phosphate dehydrogenase (NAD(P)+)